MLPYTRGNFTRVIRYGSDKQTNGRDSRASIFEADLPEIQLVNPARLEVLEKREISSEMEIVTQKSTAIRAAISA